MTKQFIDEHFLLANETEKHLYHTYAKVLPTIDYHNHLSAQEINEDIHFTSIAYAWLGAEFNIRYIFEKAFTTGERGLDYPLERVVSQQANAGILNDVKAEIVKGNYLDTLKAIDQSLVKTAVSGERFKQCFFEHCQDTAIK